MIQEDELFVIQGGVKRRARKGNCSLCGESFVVKQSDPNKFCSHACWNKHRRSTRVVVECHGCRKEFERTPSKIKNTKHGFQFCSRVCKDTSQRITGNCPEIRPTHYNTGHGLGRQKKYIRSMCEPVCVSCGESRRYLLCVHHIDGDRKHNPTDGSNWEIVCANCHIKRHLKLVDGKWEYDSNVLTPREVLSTL
jgi:hypothetical protein